MPTWAERRTAAIRREAAAVINEITKKHGAHVVRDLPRKRPLRWTLGGEGPSAAERAAVAKLTPAERDLWLDAVDALAGREVTMHSSQLDALLDTLPASKLDALAGPPPDDVIVERVEDTLPAESGATSTPGAAPAHASEPEPADPTPAPAAAKAPAESKPSRSAAPWTKLAEHREALRLLGPSSIPHHHMFVDGTCTTCRTICICPPEKCIGGACQICGKAVEQSTCQHRWAGSPPRCLRCRKSA